MRVIPVLDVMGGVVVRAVGGRRDQYRPLRSKLTGSTDPVEVARVMIEATEAKELYVADLDSILDQNKDGGLAALMCDAFPDIKVLIDVGVRDEGDVLKLNPYRPGRRIPILDWQTWEERKNLIPVIGTETVTTIDGWAKVASEFRPLLALSVDIRGDDWLGRWEPWAEWGLTETADVPDVIEVGMYALGCVFLILLDLECVGARQGYNPRIEPWLNAIRGRYTGFPVETFVGGGVRDWDDVKRLEDAGADAVLVASALHDGTLTFPRPVP